MLDKLNTWFASEVNRQKAYGVAAAIGTMLITMGLATETQVGLGLQLVGWTLSVVAAVLMLTRINWQQRLDWWTAKGRAMVYGGGVTLLSIGLGFGWWTDSDVALYTALLGQAINILAAVIAMLTIQGDVVARLEPNIVPMEKQGTLYEEW